MPPQLADRTIDARGRDSVDLTGVLGPPVFPYLADSEGSFGVSL